MLGAIKAKGFEAFGLETAHQRCFCSKEEYVVFNRASEQNQLSALYQLL